MGGETKPSRAGRLGFVWPVPGRRILGPAIFYLTLALGLTYPLAFTLSRTFYLGDMALWFWNIWWVRQSLVSLRTSPFETPYLFHPTGLDLHYQSFSFYNTLLGIPLSTSLGLVPAHHLLIITSFLLAGLGAFLLARDHGLGTEASLAAGLIYGFSPYHFADFRLDTTTIQWIPFAALYILRLFRPGTRWDPVLAAIFLTLVALSSWYYTIFMLIFFFLAFLHSALVGGRTPEWSRSLGRSLLCLGLFSVLVFPAAYPLISAILQRPEAVATGPAQVPRVDLLGFIVPTGAQSFHFVPWPVLLGYLASALAIYSLLRVKWPTKGLWVLVGTSFFILALGPRLRVGGHLVPVVRLPQAVFYYLPVLSGMRASYRFVLVVSLVVAIVAAHALDHMLRRRAPPARFAACALIVGWLVFEVYAVPLPVREPTGSDFYRALKEEAGDFAIMEVPRSAWPSALFYQTIHGKRMVGGDIGMPSPELRFIERDPVLAGLADLAVASLPSQDVVATLRSINVRYVVVRLEHWNRQKTRGLARHDNRARSYWLWPASLIRERWTLYWQELDETPGNVWERFSSSEDAIHLQRAFGQPIFRDRHLVVYALAAERTLRAPTPSRTRSARGMRASDAGLQ